MIVQKIKVKFFTAFSYMTMLVVLLSRPGSPMPSTTQDIGTTLSTGCASWQRYETRS
jgi:hypothetical protein